MVSRKGQRWTASDVKTGTAPTATNGTHNNNNTTTIPHDPVHDPSSTAVIPGSLAALAAAPAAVRSRYSEDAASDVPSCVSSDGQYEVIEYEDCFGTAATATANHTGGSGTATTSNKKAATRQHTADRHHGHTDKNAIHATRDNNGDSNTDYTDSNVNHNDINDMDNHDDDDDDNDDLLFPDSLATVTIEKDSPAAAALRANANVKVSSVGKAARAVHMQSVRRVLKHATGRSHRGQTRKGKPPRVGGDDNNNEYEFENNSNNSLVLMDEEEEQQSQQQRNDAYNSSDEWGNVTSNASKHTLTATGQPLELLREEEDEDGGGFPDESSSDIHAAAVQILDHPNDDDAAIVDLAAKVMCARGDEEDVESAKKALDRESMHQHQWDGVAPGTVEAGKKVLGSVDPHDLLKFVRWKRKKKASKKKKSYVKGKVIDGEHELYTLSIAVMIGVRTSISRTNTELNAPHHRNNNNNNNNNSNPATTKRWVRPSDFRTTEKYEFRPKGDGKIKMPPHQLAHTFKFKDYSPVAFAYLRRMYGVNEFDFLLSVCGNANFIEFISNAKSGQFFFYSSDGRYMIKTMTNAESKFLRRILPQYFKHCSENPNTAITRFFGMYRVKLYHLRRNVKFVIMNSVYYTDKTLQTFYDLKGSSIGRDAKPGQAVLKDNDLRRTLADSALVLRPKQRQHVRDQMKSDCDFLNEMGIMDYSMLVGVHHMPAFEGRVNGTATVSFRRSKTRPRKNTGGASVGEDSLSTVGDVNESKEGAIVESNLPKRRPSHIRTRSDDRLSLSGGRARTESLGSTFPFDGLEDDDNSYLLGSDNRPGSEHKVNEETERKKQATVEKLFWPFHRLFDIHGHRRLKPATCRLCQGEPCGCHEERDRKLLVGYDIPKFVPPLSDRKDGGLELDTTGLQLPLKMKGPAGGEMMYEGKIFYMGIIDVLQEYNARKAMESRYRWLQSASALSASCVAPAEYGQRFLDFFDEYTRRPSTKSTQDEIDEEGMEISVRA